MGIKERIEKFEAERDAIETELDRIIDKLKLEVHKDLRHFYIEDFSVSADCDGDNYVAVVMEDPRDGGTMMQMIPVAVIDEDRVDEWVEGLAEDKRKRKAEMDEKRIAVEIANLEARLAQLKAEQQDYE